MGPGNRPLDIEWLEDFVTLAETGSFSRAAEARTIAQPAFSRHIRALEEWVGADLVDRGAHPATLTAAGKRFLPLTEDVLARLIAARIKARMAHDQSVASLRFAATHALSLGYFPQWLGRIEAQGALGPIEMMSDSTLGCEELMLQRRAQFLMCYAHEAVPNRLDEAGVAWVKLEDDLLAPVSAVDAHGAPRFRLDQGTSLPLLAYSDSSGVGRIMRGRLRAVSAKDAPFHTVFTGHHALVLKSLALEGRGLAWLPTRLIAEELASGRLVVTGGEAWQLPLEIRLYRQPVVMSDAAEALWATVGAVAKA